jgi:hypothetical protein
MNNETQHQGQLAGDSRNAPVRARRAFDAQTISEIAQLCAKSLTQAEACRRLGLNPKSWESFKSRCGRESKFAALLEEFRAGRIESLIDRIEASADGKGMKQPDWRAAAHLLAIADPRRFKDGPTVEVNAPTNLLTVYSRMGIDVDALLAKVYSEPAKEIPAKTPKQLPEKTGNETEQKTP